MERTHTTAVTERIGQQVLVQGWAETIRDHGQLLFIDLRDQYGKVQLVIDPENKDVFNAAKEIGREFVISGVGVVRERAAEMVNDKIPTGKVEILLDQLEVVTKSKPLPFPIDTAGYEIDENMRLKYRYLDIRRERLQQNIKLRHKFILAVRNWMDAHGFTEVTTPLLTSTSPEGARDYVIPSRLYPGKFFVLPQAPQQFKQLLMVGGVDKYFQIAACARDEDPRADRHAGEFYQIDCEMSFPTIDMIFGTVENLIKDTYAIAAPEKQIAAFPFPRVTHAEAAEKYGSDKPDIRFGLELQEITEIVKNKTDFNIFNQAEVVKCIVVPGAGEWSRTQIMDMETFAKNLGAAGLAYTKVTADGVDTGIGKFLAPVATELVAAVGAKEGDLMFFGADTRELVNKILGHVRSKLGDELKLKDPNILSFAWITDFPFYEFDHKKNAIDFAHNPFSMPKGGIEAFNTDDPLTIQSFQYDLAGNGYELLSGSIRNHDPEILLKAFEVVGYGQEEIKRRFGALYNAFQYGPPPHGGFAIGIDRFFMVLSDEPNIRDVYAFPKNSTGMDVMMDAPSELPEADLKVVGIQLRPEVAMKLKQKQVSNG